jgi:hypothetical protein
MQNVRRQRVRTKLSVMGSSPILSVIVPRRRWSFRPRHGEVTGMVSGVLCTVVPRHGLVSYEVTRSVLVNGSSSTSRRVVTFAGTSAKANHLTAVEPSRIL